MSCSTLRVSDGFSQCLAEEMGMPSKEERGVFIQWAGRSMDAVHHSQRLSQLYQRVLWADGSYLSFAKAKVLKGASSLKDMAFSTLFRCKPLDLDQFATTFKMKYVLEESDLKNCLSCLNSRLLSEDEIVEAISNKGYGYGFK